ncbi:Bug family tripartite tricarboxylate transporter substrate binding protein [Ramlibacter sp. MAHUQ-53]|uniref:Bug family tripartite tricarboxylate transporter substrate binding protein n=1 Tax=unclassified Ramlibacter TaxID=2617605 RepID=UPI00363C69A7
MKTHFFLAAALMLAGITSASATDYPTRPIRIVVPYAAGGSTDVIARSLGERLTQRLGQPAIVENKPGASEQIATTTVTKAAPDGYTILLSTLTGLAVNPGLYGPRLQYDAQKELTPVLLVGSVPSVVVVNPAVPAKSMAELASYLKANPGKLNYGSAGNGTPSHLAMEYYKRQNGVDPVHVAYKGGAPALQELMAGQVQMMIALVPEAMPMVKGGKLRALAVTSARRLPGQADIPTVVESGGKPLDASFWYAFMAPVGTPPAVIEKLNQALNAILQEPGVRARFADLSVEIAGGTPAKVSELIRSDSARWKKVIDDAGIKVD